jgi:hypothetical protein
MKLVRLGYTQTVEQDVIAEVQVPDEIAEQGGNALREYLQVVQPIMEHVDVKFEEVQEDFRDIIVIEVEEVEA